MIALIQGSNRAGNATRAVIDFAAEYLREQGETVEVVDLVDMPGTVLHAGMYEAGVANDFLDAAERTLKSASRWVFAFPEYNGSFPGALKLFLDALSVRDYAGLFSNRFAALIGTASGRAGNLRGIDHFAAVLNHTGAYVMPKALPISLISTVLDAEGRFADAEAQAYLREYLQRFLDAEVGVRVEA